MHDLLADLTNLAERLALNHFEGPPVDPIGLAEHLGVEVVVDDDEPHWEHDPPTDDGHILLPPIALQQRRRFTCAHELVELAAARADISIPCALTLTLTIAWASAVFSAVSWTLATISSGVILLPQPASARLRAKSTPDRMMILCLTIHLPTLMPTHYPVSISPV